MVTRGRWERNIEIKIAPKRHELAQTNNAGILFSFFLHAASNGSNKCSTTPRAIFRPLKLDTIALRKHALNHSSTLLLIILCTWNQLINGFFHDACKVGMILKEGTVDCNDSVSCRPNLSAIATTPAPASRAARVETARHTFRTKSQSFGVTTVPLTVFVVVVVVVEPDVVVVTVAVVVTEGNLRLARIFFVSE